MNLALLDLSKPIALARIVRREKYAWPGGYELALVADDGEFICSDCVAAEWHLIAQATTQGDDNGWRAIGLISSDIAADEPHNCAHCNRVLFSER